MKSSGLVSVAALAAAIGLAGCSKSNSSTPASPTTCTVTAGSPSVTTFGPEGGTATVAVTASATSCTWTATSNATFVTISQGTSGTGSGSVQFTVAANTGGDRTGTIVIAGSTIAITQRAAAAPVTLGAPTPQSPIGGQTVESARPPLTIANATATGSPASVTYRFEVSDQSSFPNDAARTFFIDAVPQGSGGTTTATINRDLGPAVTWYWHARASAGSVTGAFSATETFKTAPVCSFALSSTAVTVQNNASNVVVNVTTTPGCAWTAASNATFISVASGATGTGNGSVTLAVAENNTSAGRSGTATIAGQTFTITQQGSAIVASFRLLDPAISGSPTTECQFRSLTSTKTTCVLESTSFPLGTNSLTTYTWTVQYTYNSVKTFTQSGSDPRFLLQDTCGGVTSTADGPAQPLLVTLTVTDSSGATATATAGTGSQPALVVRLFTCGI